MKNKLGKITNNKNYSVRTQISLSPNLKMYIDRQADFMGISMSAYIRGVLVEKIKRQEADIDTKKNIVNRFVGAGSGNNAWGKTKTSVLKWQKEIRKDKDVYS